MRLKNEMGGGIGEVGGVDGVVEVGEVGFLVKHACLREECHVHDKYNQGQHL